MIRREFIGAVLLGLTAPSLAGDPRPDGDQ